MSGFVCNETKIYNRFSFVDRPKIYDFYQKHTSISERSLKTLKNVVLIIKIKITTTVATFIRPPVSSNFMIMWLFDDE